MCLCCNCHFVIIKDSACDEGESSSLAVRVDGQECGDGMEAYERNQNME